jgi:cyclopropane-fatty-acyl-phospholipid synthase
MFLKLLNKHIKYGQLELCLPNGKCHRFGDHGPAAQWNINNKDTMRRIVRDWEFELGETYISGGWDVAQGELRDLLGILRYNFQEIIPTGAAKAAMLLQRIPQQWNRLSNSLRQIHHHYDLDEDMFTSFLDDDMHYSCAYFEYEDQSLENAQQAKCKMIAQKLLLKPGQEILDIGCGWGSLSMYLAEHYDVKVTGITLSKQQLKVAWARAEKRGLSDKVDFQLIDYRQLSEKNNKTYDRIVSVGMFEHVGKPYFNTYFRSIKQLLKADGHALIHTIGRSGPPGATNPWIRKHIFPGGYIPAMSEVTSSIENSLMVITDVEILRQHYARTLAAWYRRFNAKSAAIKAKHGEYFYRLWEFYLNICEISFKHSDLVVFQIQLAKTNDTLPITRNYMSIKPEPALKDWRSKSGNRAKEVRMPVPA